MSNNSSLETDSMYSTSFKQNDLKVSSVSDIIKEGNKDAAAIKVQKVYRSYRTRRNLADGAVGSNQLWWHTIDSIMLEQNLFYDISKPVTAIARLSRASLRAAKVGKGLSKDKNARELAVQHWLEAKEREHYEVIPQNGKLIYKKSGQLIDTTEGCGESRWIFVMSTSKELYVGKKLRGTFQHSSFLAGGATSAAGKLTVQDGVLKAIWPYSGHYHPTEQNLSELLNFPRESGIDTADVQTGSYSKEAHSLSVTKKESKKKKNPPETLDSNILQKTHSIDKNNIGVTNAETEREENQPTDILNANILHEAHTESNTLGDDKNNIAAFHDEEQNESDVKTGMSSLLSQLGSTEGTERTKTGGGKENQDPVHYKRSLSGELEIPPSKLLERVNSKKAIQSYQLGKQLSFK